MMSNNEPLQHGPLRILAVEDDEADRLCLAELLQTCYGAQVKTSWGTDANAGLSLLQQHSFDICLLDYRLPGMDGLSVLEHIRGAGIDVPVIMLTGSGSYAVDVAAMQRGASAFIAKEDLDAPLLERTIRYLLRTRVPQSFLEELASPTLRPQLPGQRLHVGQTIIQGRFRLERPIGSGTMGQVHAATQLSLNRRVALKIIHPQFGQSRHARARFKREALALARLDHPNVVRVYDHGEWRGMLYLVMEYIEAVPLDLPDILTLSQLGNLITQVAAALDAAANAGIVHRDVKPDNILITAKGAVKMVDFGIAVLANDRVTDAAGPDSGQAPFPQSASAGSAGHPAAPKGATFAERTARLTDRGVIAGTPDFMAPEQALAKHVDHLTDVYGLGALCYWLLTGESLFAASGLLDLMRKIVEEDPRPPSRINSVVTPALDSVVLQALAKQPEHRPSSAGAFARQLGYAIARTGDCRIDRDRTRDEQAQSQVTTEREIES